jgi:hypothetical protein
MHQHHLRVRGPLASVVLATACAGRGLDPTPAPEDRPPIADTYLDRSDPLNRGLLTGLGPDGLPLTSGPGMDPQITEARRFYDTVQYPFAVATMLDYPDPITGEENYVRKTSPLTLDAWKSAFGFAAPNPNESLVGFRARSGVVVYYNQNELGLGRELGCASFADQPAADGTSPIGLACFVTNYGAVFDDPQGSLADATAGVHPRNTVCITYRPSLGAGYEVQFYAFAGDGRRIEWAQLDTLGPRPHPEVCMNCHGGTYDGVRHLARGARFLPLDPSGLVFADAAGPYGRAPEEERIRKINQLSLGTPLTASQADYVRGMYAGAVDRAGSAAASWAPAGWQGTPGDTDLYTKVVRPYCGTCHQAIETTQAGAASPLYQGMTSAADFKLASVGAYLCAFQMPNAQPTMAGLWRVLPDGLAIGATSYASGADALLDATVGGTRQVCPNLAAESDCRRGSDPDALCGDPHSGTACDLETGECLTATTLDATYDPRQPTGVCRTDGTRTCPEAQECRPQDMGVPGYDGACYTCGRAGRLACTQSTPCEAGLTVDSTGLCNP